METQVTPHTRAAILMSCFMQQHCSSNVCSRNGAGGRKRCAARSRVARDDDGPSRRAR